MSHIKNLLKKTFTGLTVPQEYVCVDLRSLEQKLTVVLDCDETFRSDVTTTHTLLGYRPLVIAVSLVKDSDAAKQVGQARQVKLNFLLEKVTAYSASEALATLTLKKSSDVVDGNQHVFFFEGLSGKHHFISAFHQWIGRIRQKTRKRLAGNIDLPGNLYDQVRIAYSVPRKISVVSVGDKDMFNMFPTDLHGPGGEELYFDSLRIGGVANAQVEQAGRITLSDVGTTYFRDVYALGKNHMRPMQGLEDFAAHPERSKVFGLPLPVGANSYLELQRMASRDVGIHRIHFYRVVSGGQVAATTSVLAHVHQYYAQWRLDRGMKTSMYLR